MLPETVSLPPEPTTPAVPGRSSSLRVAALGLLTIALVFTLKYAQDALIPITMAVFLAYALMPLVLWLKKRARVPQPVGAALALLLIITGVPLTAMIVQPQVVQLIDQVPQATQKLKGVLHRTALDRTSAVRRLTTAADELEKAATTDGAGHAADIPGSSPFRLRDLLWAGTAAMIGVVAQAVIVLALSYFLLISGHDFKRKVVRISGNTLRNKKLTVQILEEIDLQIQRYLLIQISTSAMVGVLTGIAFALIGLENALFWGIAAGVLHLIPYVGSTLVLGAAAIFAYVQFSTNTQVLLVVGSGTLIVVAVGLGLVPWLTQRVGQMNAVATFVALIVWDWLWGVPGLLLGIPIMMATMAVCERIDGLRSFAELLNAEAPKPVPLVNGAAAAATPQA